MEALKIKFEGGNEIDANTLINSLLHFVDIVQEIHKDYSKELSIEKKLEIKIKATTPGSFEVATNLIATSIGTGLLALFSKETIGYTANLVQAIGGAYSFAKFLKGKKT